MSANDQVTKYIQGLYQYLGDKYCFLSGAFVIDDTNQRLFKLLYSNPKTPLGGLLSSHLKFNQHKVKPKDPEYFLYETRFKAPIKISCKCKDNPNDIASREFRSMKWYKFLENNKHFVYLKIEDYRTVSVEHGINAVSRYIFHHSNASCREDRREDCEKGGTVCKYAQTKGPNYNKVIFNTSDERDVTETYTRKGDEMFIPNDVNEYILQNVETSDPLFLYNDNNTITGLHGYKRKMERQSAQRNIDIEPESVSEPVSESVSVPVSESEPVSEPVSEPELPPPTPEDLQPSPLSEPDLLPPASDKKYNALNLGGKRKSKTVRKHKKSTRSNKSKQNKRSTQSKKYKKSKKTKRAKHSE